MGRAEADITKWITYFIEGMATSFEKVRDQAVREAEKGGKDQSKLLRNLDSKQRRALTLFQKSSCFLAGLQKPGGLAGFCMALDTGLQCADTFQFLFEIRGCIDLTAASHQRERSNR